MATEQTRTVFTINFFLLGEQFRASLFSGRVNERQIDGGRYGRHAAKEDEPSRATADVTDGGRRPFEKWLR